MGTVRRLPRGVPKSEYARRDYFDVWLPNLVPSEAIVKWALGTEWDEKKRKAFARKYRAEMSRPDARHLVATLAALSKDADFSVGCYCEDETRCHRSVLRELLEEAGGKVAR